MITEIIKFREQGVSFRKIAKELNTTVGRVQYQWVKYQKTLDSDVSPIEKNNYKKRVGKIRVGKAKSLSKDNRTYINNLTITYSTSSRIFCYWNFSQGWIEYAKNHFGISSTQPFVLRLYDITSITFNGHNHHSYLDSYVPHSENEWFISGLKENRSYCIDIGFGLSSGEFIALIRSNVLQTPRTSNHQDYHSVKEFKEFEQGLINKPRWVEHVSTYSYYVMNQEEQE